MDRPLPPTTDKIPVGVSQCLLGAPVRFDGGHRYDAYLTEVMGRYLEFHAVCPEVAIGLGTPRQPIRLVATDSGTRVQGLDGDLDVTEALAAEAATAAAGLPQICGYVFMQKSPSCGVFAMKRYTEDGRLLDTAGRGAFAQKLMELLPLLPVEESARLGDPTLRDSFISRVLALDDWRRTFEKAPSAQALGDFYSRYRFQVMAHHPASNTAVEDLLANAQARPLEEVRGTFLELFMGALQHPATHKDSVEAMRHLRDDLDAELSSREKRELDSIIDAYGRSELPLAAPLMLFRSHRLAADQVLVESRKRIS